MSSYVRRAMQDNERILYAAQLHWIIYHMGVGILIFGALVGHFGPTLIGYLFGEGEIASFASRYIKYIALGIVGLGALEILFAYIRQISTELVITNQRVIAKHGFVSTTSYELMLMKVEGATIDQSVLGRMLGYGTLMVKGTGGGISPIDHVANPYIFHNHLMTAIHAAQDEMSGNGNHGHD